MPKLHPVPSGDIVRTLERLGFTRVRQRGSYLVLKRITTGGSNTCVVPMHGEVKVGTLRSILHQADVTVDEFLRNL